MGKIERLHRTLKTELLQGRRFLGFEAAQAGLDMWRRHYNHERPHEALDGAVPASRYLMSQRSPLRSLGPATLPEPEYLDDDLVGRIRKNGCLHCRTAAPSTSSSPSPSPANWSPSARQPRTASATSGSVATASPRSICGQIPSGQASPISSHTCNPCLRSV